MTSIRIYYTYITCIEGMKRRSAHTCEGYIMGEGGGGGKHTEIEWAATA